MVSQLLVHFGNPFFAETCLLPSLPHLPFESVKHEHVDSVGTENGTKHDLVLFLIGEEDDSHWQVQPVGETRE